MVLRYDIQGSHRAALSQRVKQGMSLYSLVAITG